MTLIGFEDINEIHGFPIGIFAGSDTALGSKGLIRDGTAFVDCLPAIAGKYVCEIPDDVTIAVAVENGAPYPFVMIVDPATEFGAFVVDSLAKKGLSSN